MCGTPVVGLQRGGLPEVVTDGLGRLVASGHGVVQRLAAALDVVAGVSRGVVAAHARATLSLDQMLEGYERLLVELGCPDPAVGHGSHAAAPLLSSAAR